MAAAKDQPRCGNHAVGALLARQSRILFDPVDRDFGRAPEHRKHRAIFQKIDGVVPPFPVSDHAPIQIEYSAELEAIECHPAWWSDGGADIALRRAILAWISLLRNQTH